jgi:hypothetical protein
LLRKIDDTLVIKYSHTNLPPRVLSVRFKSTEGNLASLLADGNLEVNVIESIDLKTPIGDAAFSEFLASEVESFVHETISLENGAEAFFIRSKNLDSAQLHPMVVILHGGPFSAS